VDDSDGVYIAWEDLRLPLGGDRIYFAFSPNAGDSFLANVRVDDLPEDEEYWLWTPTLAINKEKEVFIAWMDDRINHMVNFDIYFALGTYMGIYEYCEAKPTITMRCYPNPFSKLINISFSRGQSAKSRVYLKIYDISGRLVKQFTQLPDDQLLNNQITWDGRDENGQVVSSGIYFIELVSDNKKYIKKIVKIK